MGASATDAYVYTAVNNAAGMQNYLVKVTLTGTVKAAKYYDMHKLLDAANTKVNHVMFIRQPTMQHKTPYVYAFGSLLKYDNIAPMAKSAAFAFKMSTSE
jgi:hypothetical protein